MHIHCFTRVYSFTYARVRIVYDKPYKVHTSSISMCSNNLCIFILSSITKQTVALKEIRLQPEEGAPFTAIREGNPALDYYRLHPRPSYNLSMKFCAVSFISFGDFIQF